ncbi:uncharacterized protein TRAVEDRAFT_25329 [Trametes versicolor FP-101664 SS1]|uniref:uncharacterized protein n=1 Tax=Trametes versicolor (strain FP-101664) TaxID=717944 RepID=UPI0004622696|nr:uncharacterized protein TRAVEDRAFT_25329 [Trametes versicolor FP-101664 SS1]EIW63988.1 hypothetical protein TRAVEDRAFT_25329 [Trametes versicolor FP-101664 SS1]
MDPSQIGRAVRAAYQAPALSCACPAWLSSSLPFFAETCCKSRRTADAHRLGTRLNSSPTSPAFGCQAANYSRLTGTSGQMQARRSSLA